MSKKHNKGRIPPGGFVWLHNPMADTTAWRMLTPGAKCLYLALKRHLSNDYSNNGRVFLSVRDAAKQVGSNKGSIQRWFRELQYYEFIVQTSPGTLGADGKGKAAYWRLTEVPCKDEPATRDYMYWDGEKFRDLPAQKKQNPVPTSGDRVYPLYRTLGGAEIRRHAPPTVPTTGDIETALGVPTTGDISSKPLYVPSSVSGAVSGRPKIGVSGRYKISADPRAMEQWFAIGRGRYEISAQPGAMLPWSTPHIEEIAA